MLKAVCSGSGTMVNHTVQPKRTALPHTLPAFLPNSLQLHIADWCWAWNWFLVDHSSLACQWVVFVYTPYSNVLHYTSITVDLKRNSSTCKKLVKKSCPMLYWNCIRDLALRISFQRRVIKWKQVKSAAEQGSVLAIEFGICRVPFN